MLRYNVISFLKMILFSPVIRWSSNDMLGCAEMIKKLYENFHFEQSHVYEMFILMLQITGSENSDKGTYHKPEVEELNEWRIEQRKSLSSEILEELHVFVLIYSFFVLSLT